MNDANAQRAQIEQILDSRFMPMIPLPTGNQSDADKRLNCLSRSLAAFAVHKISGCDPVDAVSSVIDASDDNGIDAVYFDSSSNRLLLIQSKYGDAPDHGDTLKFTTGIGDLMIARYDRFNDAFQRLLPVVDVALNTPGVVVHGVTVHLGDGLERHATADLETLKGKLNIHSDLFTWSDKTREIVHGWITDEHIISIIDVDLTLENWSTQNLPTRAFYGSITAQQLAVLYQAHGKKILEKNIRHYLGDKVVNTAIAETVQTRPNELFYLNNGITAVCNGVVIPPVATGRLHFRGFSVVNGAQTVGSIHKVFTQSGNVSPEAKVLITILEVLDTDSPFSREVTKARNTQNPLRAQHYYALDPNQERLRRELAISGITYFYRPTEDMILTGENLIGFEEATVALASFRTDTRTVVTLKKESGSLFDQDGNYYSHLFTEHLSGIHLCRVVRVYRYLKSILSPFEGTAGTPRARAFYRHGLYFILHIFARRHQAQLNNTELTLSIADQLELSRIITDLAETVYTEAERLFATTGRGYLAIFRNITESEELMHAVMQRLAQPPIVAPAQPTTAPPVANP